MNFYGKISLICAERPKYLWSLATPSRRFDNQSNQDFNDTSNPKVYSIEYIDWKSDEKDVTSSKMASFSCPEKFSIIIE